jgi:hypothetical protein
MVIITIIVVITEYEKLFLSNLYFLYIGKDYFKYMKISAKKAILSGLSASYGYYCLKNRQ